MTDGDHLLAAILANPDDDAPRLAFADWCDENGESERGDFVRAGCESNRLCGRPSKNGYSVGLRSRKCATAFERSLELEAKYNQRWFPFFGFTEVWDRGFVYSLSASAADWLAHGDAILAQHPVTEVTLTTWPETHLGFDEEIMTRSAAILERLMDRWPRVRKWHLPAERWDGAFERSLLVNQPEFAGVEYWHPSETTARAIVHPVLETPVPWRSESYLAVPTGLGACRVDLQVYVVNGYRLRAGRCSHGRAFFTRAERYQSEPGESEAAFAAGFASR